MRRNSLLTAFVAVTALMAFAATAVAATPGPVPKSPQTCTTSSRNVIGKTVKGTLTSRNVDPVQARFATCAQAKKVMSKITSIRVEEPRPTMGFHCVPTVLSTEPDVVKYSCVFKGADTATFIKLLFKVTYDMD